MCLTELVQCLATHVQSHDDDAGFLATYDDLCARVGESAAMAIWSALILEAEPLSVTTYHARRIAILAHQIDTLRPQVAAAWQHAWQSAATHAQKTIVAAAYTEAVAREQQLHALVAAMSTIQDEIDDARCD